MSDAFLALYQETTSQHLWYFTAVLTNKIKHVNPFYFLVHQFYVIYLPYILNLMIPNTGSSKYAVFKRYQLTVFDLIKASFQNISCVHVYFFLMHKVTVKGEAKQMENTVTDSSLDRGNTPWWPYKS